MQSLEEAAKAAEGCVLGEAERRMNAGEGHPDGGTCAGCASFREVECSEEVPGILRRQLGYCGLCMDAPREPVVVDRSEWHSWDECWTEG